MRLKLTLLFRIQLPSSGKICLITSPAATAASTEAVMYSSCIELACTPLSMKWLAWLLKELEESCAAAGPTSLDRSKSSGDQEISQ